MSGGLGKVVGFFYFWPLTLLTTLAVWACMSLTRPEIHDGVLTGGGKRLVRSRALLGICCALDYLLIALGVAFKSSSEPMLVLGFWDRHWHWFLALLLGAELSMLMAMILSFGARGSRRWILQTATVLLGIFSTVVTYFFLSPE
jgi:hypothetical protein